jgi:hypothetical protein
MTNRVSPLDAQSPTVAPEAAPQKVLGASERLLSLDTFRGFTMFWIVGGGALIWPATPNGRSDPRVIPAKAGIQHLLTPLHAEGEPSCLERKW